MGRGTFKWTEAGSQMGPGEQGQILSVSMLPWCLTPHTSFLDEGIDLLRIFFWAISFQAGVGSFILS